MLFNVLVSTKFKKFRIVNNWFNLKLLSFKKKSGFFFGRILKIFKKKEANFKKELITTQRSNSALRDKRIGGKRFKIISKPEFKKNLLYKSYASNFINSWKKKNSFWRVLKAGSQPQIKKRKTPKIVYSCYKNASSRFFFKFNKKEKLRECSKILADKETPIFKMVEKLVSKTFGDLLTKLDFYNYKKSIFLKTLHRWFKVNQKELFLSYFVIKKKIQWLRSRFAYSLEYYANKKASMFYSTRMLSTFSYFDESSDYDVSKYKKLLNYNWSIFNYNKKARALSLRIFEHDFLGCNTYSYFNFEIFNFFRELSKKILFSIFLKKKLFVEKKFFFIKIKVESKYNSITFSNGLRKFILKRTTKSLGIKTRKMRRDIIKTKFLFQKIFYLFKKFVKSKFRIRDFHNYSFIFSLEGDILKTSKIFRYVVSKSKCKIFSILDETAIPHNGCRAPKRRRKKNKGRNKYVKKLRSN